MEYMFYSFAFLLSVFLIIKVIFHQNKNLPPSPFSLPIIGHLHLLKQPLHLSLENLLSKYGPIIFLQLGWRSVVVVSSPSVVEECFTKNDIVFANRPTSLSGDILTYNYTSFAFSPYGHLWRNLRRVSVNEMFSKNSLQKSSGIRDEEVCSLIRLVSKISNCETEKVNLNYVFLFLAFNIIMRIVSGEKCVKEEIACTDSGEQYLMELRKMFLGSATMNLLDFLPVLQWIDYKGVKRSLIKLHKRRDEFLQNLIDEFRRKKDLEKSRAEEQQRILIESLLSLQDSEPEFYSDEIIKGLILVILVAGTETTAVTMEWAFSLLLNHPEELQKVKDEIDSQVGHMRLLNEMDLPKLPYLRCVINETLRLYPSAPLLLPHCASEDCTVEGYKVPRGTILMVNAWAMHRDPTVWEEPALFKPERFRGIEGEREGFKFIAFGTGRRVCPGDSMGIRTVMLALGALIQCFEWERVGPEMVNMNQGVGLSLHKAETLEAVCRPRHSISTFLF